MNEYRGRYHIDFTLHFNLQPLGGSQVNKADKEPLVHFYSALAECAYISHTPDTNLKYTGIQCKDHGDIFDFG